ncbi:MAG: hypothetical protein K1X79_10875 [Oligoflexia bacterium]|nr:hypothetical protein [Oligoflexia bacterium]
MSAPVTIKPDATGLSTANAVASSGERDIKVALPDAALSALSPGAVVNIEVEREGQRSGFFLQGQFIPAKLPANLVDGQRVQVQVQGASDALLLRVLNLAPEGFENYFSNTVQDLIKELLPNIDLKPLRLGSSPLPDGFVGKLLGFNATPITADSLPAEGQSASPQNLKLLQIFDKLMGNQSILNPPQLESPDQLQKFLKNVDAQSLLKGLADANNALQKLGDAKLQPGQVRFAELLESTLRALLDSKEPLNAESKSTPAVLAPQLKLYLLASQNALDHQNAETLKAINAEIPALRRLDNPLLSLQKLLQHIQFPAESPTPLSKAVTDLVKGLSVDLYKAIESKLPEKELREVLAKHAARAQSIIKEFGEPAQAAPALAQASETLRGLEQLARSQEALNKLNPIMHALGEPMLILFPALAGGLLSKWQLRIDPSQVEAEGRKKGSAGSNGNFERIDISLSLPALGAVEINFAHRKGEALIQFTLTKEDGSLFLTERGATLEKRFQELGYEKVSIAARAGTPQNVLPPWFRELTRGSIVA